MIPKPAYLEFALELAHVSPRRKLSKALAEPHYALPSHRQFQGQPAFAEVGGAWNKRGLHFRVAVHGRQRPVQVDPERHWRLDCFEVWIDTRGDRTIRRATRFCHQFVCLPLTSQRSRRPTARQVNIGRAREAAKLCDPGKLVAESVIHPHGYELTFTIAAEALTGFDPDEYRTLGLAYHLNDVDFGAQAFPLDKSLPVDHNPSLWAHVELTP